MIACRRPFFQPKAGATIPKPFLADVCLLFKTTEKTQSSFYWGVWWAVDCRCRAWVQGWEQVCTVCFCTASGWSSKSEDHSAVAQSLRTFQIPLNPIRLNWKIYVSTLLNDNCKCVWAWAGITCHLTVSLGASLGWDLHGKKSLQPLMRQQVSQGTVSVECPLSQPVLLGEITGQMLI